MSITTDAAPEIDRLVLSVNRNIDNNRIGQLAAERGLDNLDMILHWRDFLLAGVLTPDLAALRSRYVPGDRVRGRLDELETKGLIRSGGTGLAATPTMVPLLEALSEAQTAGAAEAWRDHEAAVATVTTTADEIAAAASDEHVVAVVHRGVPRPSNPYAGLHHRLVTLRYIRQHDHAEAWGAEDLTASDMVVMTALWHGESVEESADGLSRLVDLGFARGDPPALTAAGREIRESIEAETNRRAQETFDVLDDRTGEEFLSALRLLPSL